MDASDSMLYSNCSTHRPVWTSWCVMMAPCASKTPSAPPNVKSEEATVRFKWEETDHEIYQERMRSEIQQYNWQQLSPYHAAEVFQACLNTAKAASTPATEIKPNKNKRQQRYKWTEEAQLATSKAKSIHHVWKEAGRPEAGHPVTELKKQAKRELSRLLTKQKSEKRHTLFTEISVAAEGDQKVFNKLVQLQRETRSKGGALLINGTVITAEHDIREQWATYFQKLGTPNKSYPELQDLVSMLRTVYKAQTDSPLISSRTVIKAIKGLNTGKAADIYSTTAEQLRALPEEAIDTLTLIINCILKACEVPDNIKASYKITVPKKGKDERIQDNNRGITVAPVIYKVLEKICLDNGLAALVDNNMQFGFTEGRSPAMASLIISEAQSESRAMGVPLIAVTEDARKAFDVVNHDKLKMKLHQRNLDPMLWLLLDDMYTGGSERFRYKGGYSEPYVINQGVKQGGNTSPNLYKVYIHPMLDSLERHKLGLSIGCIYLGSPTCADDVLMLSNESLGAETQAMIDVTKQHSTKNDYDIHPTKSGATILHNPSSNPVQHKQWTLGEVRMPLTDNFVHLGLQWHEGRPAPNIEVSISSSRRTGYKLMGAGLHGQNGLSPGISMRIVSLYVQPVLLSGLEACVLKKKELDILDSYHKKLLRCIQGLP